MSASRCCVISTRGCSVHWHKPNTLRYPYRFTLCTIHLMVHKISVVMILAVGNGGDGNLRAGYQYTSAARALAAPRYARTRWESELLWPGHNRASSGLAHFTWRALDDSGPCWKIGAHLSSERNRTGN